jgi:hypothetical protein
VVRDVTADPNRRFVDRREVVREHFTTRGRPAGHGFTDGNVAAGTAYYAFDGGIVRCLVLDTVNGYGGANGSLDATQFGWLERELVAGHRRHLDPAGALTDSAGTDRLFVVFSHHTVASMDNWLAPPESRRVLGHTVRDLLLCFPNVVLWVNGHTHINAVTAHARAPDAAVAGGLFELTTASLIDWPQQARLIEVVDNVDGTLSVLGTIVDTAAGPGPLPASTAAAAPSPTATWNWSSPRRSASPPEAANSSSRSTTPDVRSIDVSLSTAAGPRRSGVVVGVDASPRRRRGVL